MLYCISALLNLENYIHPQLLFFYPNCCNLKIEIIKARIDLYCTDNVHYTIICF